MSSDPDPAGTAPDGIRPVETDGAGTARAGRSRRRWSPLEILARYGFLFVFAAVAVLFAVRADAFLNGSNLVNILEGYSILLIAALAMTLVVASGGIDLSIGIAIDFGGWLAIVAMMNHGAPWPVALVVAVVAGATVGLFNSFLIVRLGIGPFLATLGTFFIGGSIQRIYTSGGGNVAFREMPAGYRNIATSTTLGVPNEVLLAALVLVVYWLLLEQSKHGKRIHAIGLQRSAATVSGIRVGRYLAVVYVLASGTAALSGVIVTAGLRSFTPLGGFTYLLDSIAAVFIGASIHPRQRPNVPGTLIGVLFLGMVSNGLNLMGLEFNFRDALEGIILVGALAFAVAQRRLLGTRRVVS